MAASSRTASIRCTAAKQMDSRSPSMRKRLSRVVLAHEGGHELVACQDLSSDDALVMESSSVVNFGFGLITFSCELEE